MKLVNMTLVTMAIFTLLQTSAAASNKQVGGLLLGGGAGAIIGQAIGQNAESTIVGATVGGVIGLVVGNELDSHHESVDQPAQVIAYAPRYQPQRQIVLQDHYSDFPNYRHDREKCRKIVTIDKKHHRTKQVVSIVCASPKKWNNKNHNPQRYNDRLYR